MGKQSINTTLTTLEIEKKPPVAEVEVRAVTVLVHELEQLWVQNLLQRNNQMIIVCSHRTSL